MDISITKDSDLLIGYEINSPLKKIINLILIPILCYLPSHLRKAARKTHESAADVIDKAMTHEALEVIYQHGLPHRSKTIFQRFFRYLWSNTNNQKAVRNRLRLVTREILKILQSKTKDKKNIFILSIAAGSARSIVDALSLMGKKGRIDVSFLDKNELANEYSKKLVKSNEFPPGYNFRWITDTASNFSKYYNNGHELDIVEIVGLLDYLDNEKIYKIFSIIYKYLKKDGTLITSNIRNNSEKRFVSNFVGWKMIYREPIDLYSLALRAGFKKENIKVYIEPLGIHFVLIAQK